MGGRFRDLLQSTMIRSSHHPSQTMPSPDILLTFIITALLLSIVPGPGMLYIAAQTIARGRKAGWHAAVGTHFASYVHIIAAAFGLSVLLQVVPAAYLALKIIGALYLFWLGFRFLMRDEPIEDPLSASDPRSHIKALKESFVVEQTNPKSAVFFIAFLPQFADPHAAWPLWAQIIVLGLIANLIFSLVEICCVIFADSIASFVRESRSAGRWMRRVAGTVMIGLGANLLLSQR
jgi:threonine/homoserine/homoserine lactone efflux protein